MNNESSSERLTQRHAIPISPQCSDATFHASCLIIDIAYYDQMENVQIIDHNLFPHMKGIILIIGTPFIIVI